MRKWTQQDYQTMPWKNGAGSTTELAIFPQNASLDHFIWRLSTASVSSEGPFSHFPRIDRTLAILSGDGLILHSDSETAHARSIRLEPTSVPYQFSGETPVHAELIHGQPVLDLSMMTRRDVCTHYMQRLGAGDHYVEAGDAQQLLLYCAKGKVTLKSGEILAAGELGLFEEKHEHEGILLGFCADEDAVLYLIRIQFLNMGQS